MAKSKRTPSAEEKIIQGLKGVADALKSGDDHEDSVILASRGSVKSRWRRLGIWLAISVFVIVILIAALAYYHEVTSLGDREGSWDNLVAESGLTLEIGVLRTRFFKA